MNDPVSRELEARARASQPWFTAVAAAVFLHATVAAALVLLPEKSRRAVTLPSIQVRLTTPVLPSAPALDPAVPARTDSSPATRPEPAAPPEPAPARTVPRPTAAPVQPRPRPTAIPAVVPPPPDTAQRPGGPDRSIEPGPSAPRPEIDPGPPGARSVGLGTGARGPTDEHFPFAYYLERILVAIEGNWFRPAVPAETRSRIRCRIDRTGRILEAGIEIPSGIPAFDRAALRAVYAAAPFPPLPQGFGGSTLTLYLEFGQ